MWPARRRRGTEWRWCWPGTPQIRTGEQLLFVKVVAVAPAVARRDGRIQALAAIPLIMPGWARWSSSLMSWRDPG